MDTINQKMAKAIIHYSTAVKPGERVFIRSTSPAGEPLAQALYQEALRANAHAFTYIHLRDESSLALEATTDPALLATLNPMLELMYKTSDVIIRIEASENPRALSDYPIEAQEAYTKTLGPLMKLQMEREGNGTLRRCTTLYPTHAYAQAAGMSYPQYQAFVREACKLHFHDPAAAWYQLSARQQTLLDYLKGKKQLHITGNNIDLRMSIANRHFLNDDGRANFPGGEVFTGPVEDSVNGWVKFTYPAYYGGNEVQGVELTFKDGLITQATAKKNQPFLETILNTDPGAKRLGEFAIGTNYDIKRFTGSMLFDEKIGGTVHMAMGQGYIMSGSKNISAIHWDMVCDMRDGGEILIDDELFYKDGKLLIEM